MRGSKVFIAPRRTLPWVQAAHARSAPRRSDGNHRAWGFATPNIVLGTGPVLRQIQAVIDQGAYVLRETTGTSGIELTARAAVEVLAEHEIPHLFAGGLAVQEYGYHRVTLDVDVVVRHLYLETWDAVQAEPRGAFP
jgi:hypothetical protein